MKGILFKPDMLQAIATGAKTVTRRLESSLKEINKEPGDWVPTEVVREILPYVKPGDWLFSLHGGPTTWRARPRYLPGEVVYCKEAWQFVSQELADSLDYDFGVRYADGEIRWWTDNGNNMKYPLDTKKQSPLFMPEWAARYFIRIVSVRPERLQEITFEDCLAEGIAWSELWGDSERFQKWAATEGQHLPLDTYIDAAWIAFARGAYAALWDTINGAGSWDRNPWVFRYEFEKVDR